MKIALVELSAHNRLNIYSLVKMARGIPILAGILHGDGHETTCFVESMQKFDWRQLLDYPVIGFSAITCTITPTYHLIGKLRAAGYKGIIILGGPHPTSLPEEGLRSGANYIVRHEGDKTLPSLIRALEDDAPVEPILGISYFKQDQIVHNADEEVLSEEELSQLPPPAFETIRGFRKMKQVPLNFSRGCPFRCKFCAVATMFGGEYRSLSVEARLKTLSYIRDNYRELWREGIFFFTDDNFFGNGRTRKITLQFMEELIRQNLIPPKGWLCQARVGDISIEIATLMVQAGCRYICFGIESADPEALVAFNKGQSSLEIKTAISNAHGVGIKIIAMMVAGSNADTFRSVLRSVYTAKTWGIDFLQLLALVPLPGTVLTKKLEIEKRIKSHDYNKYNGHYVVIKPKKMSCFGLWAAIWLLNFWFYFLTANGRKLMRDFGKEFFKMTLMVFRHWIFGSIRR